MVATCLLAVVLMIVLSFVVFRHFARKDCLVKGRLGFLSYFLEVVIFALHANFSYLFALVKWPSLPHLPERPVLYILARLLLVSGLPALLASLVGLGLGRTLGQDRMELEKGGLYRYSRNLQLLGYGLVLAAFALTEPSV